ncbi:MAG: N-acetyl-gamma-glutamyl-phosphate reductase [Thermoplasmatota archaeon]
MMSRAKAGIVGASGYTGSELLRITSGHPRIQVEAVTSESNKGKPLTDVFPHLDHIVDGSFCSLDELDLTDLDVLFLALPHTVSMNYVKEIWGEDVRIVDLSGDFRISSSDIYESWYKAKHSCPELIEHAVFGLPELFRDAIKGSRFVSNPGCYPTSAILPLAPLLRDRLIEPDDIIVDSKSGVTGAGAKANQGTHFPTLNDSFKAYKLGVHRHTPEMEETLSIFSDQKVDLQFTPHLLPINRGILSTCYTRTRNGVVEQDLMDSMRSLYGDEKFIRLKDAPPSTREVRGSNFCDIHLHHDERTGRTLIVSAIDNLVKGASGQAVQNMNLMMGYREEDGLMMPSLVP